MSSPIESRLGQSEIDRLLKKPTESSASATNAPARPAADAYDFRRPDRIPKEQLRSIHLMHDFLARNLASSLGAYLRAYVTVRLVSVEQLSFGEFLQYLPTPTCISSIGMRPLDGNSVLEINPSLVMPMLDVLLGGSGNVEQEEVRELTEIEQSITEGVLRVVLHDLHEAWAPVADINFDIEATETQPQLMQILSTNEAIVAIGFEVTMGETRGMMNFGVPSILVKMMGQKFEQQWSIRRRSSAEEDQSRMRELARAIPIGVEARVSGARIGMREVLGLERGDIVSLSVPAKRPAEVLINGRSKFLGEVVTVGRQWGVALTGPASGARRAAKSRVRKPAAGGRASA